MGEAKRRKPVEREQAEQAPNPNAEQVEVKAAKAAANLPCQGSGKQYCVL